MTASNELGNTKLPGWAQAILIGLTALLFSVVSLLSGHIFTEMDTRVTKIDDTVGKMLQSLVVLEARVDTQSKFCRFPTLKGEEKWK